MHAGVGWSTASLLPDGAGDFRILDPAVPGVFVHGGFDDAGGRTDDEIIIDLARALAVDNNARQMIGPMDRQYLTGFSDSSDPVLRLVTSGRATGVFDFALPFVASGHDPQAAITSGHYGGKLMVVNSESEGTSADLVDCGVAPDHYRFYTVAGTPHIPDGLVAHPLNADKTTPASFQPALRAHFLQGDKWVRTGSVPPPSNHLKTSAGGTLDRDESGNAISVNASGQPVPRLPFVELHEAHFIVPPPAGLVLHPLLPTEALGICDSVKTIADLGFASHRKYLQEFKKAADDCVRAGYMLKEDADAMRSRAALCPELLTFTGVYHGHYDKFTAIESC